MIKLFKTIGDDVPLSFAPKLATWLTDNPDSVSTIILSSTKFMADNSALSVALGKYELASSSPFAAFSKKFMNSTIYLANASLEVSISYNSVLSTPTWYKYEPFWIWTLSYFVGLLLYSIKLIK